VIPAIALVVAYAADLRLGEPPNAIHPVAWIGSAIARGREWALAAGPRGQLARGALLTASVCGASAGLAHALGALTARAPAIVSALLCAALLKPLFAVRALREAAFTVRDALERDDLDEARRALSSLCSRDASALEGSSIAAAAVESLAENASDSIVAPVLYFGAFGLPGAAFYRASNTLDAMIGYHGRFEWAGKVAARLDDALNLVPARVTALLLIVAGIVCRADARRGIAVLLRDGALTESPNAGRPMSAMAGLLGVRLEKAGHYALGDARRPIEARDITRAWRLVSVTAFGAVIVTAALLAVAGGAR
jgi:adenosylcobinamide-phosphate synthase